MILDTNILLDYPQIVTKDDEYWIVSIRVLKEIDALKISPNQETARKARKAAVYLSKNFQNIEWDMTETPNKSTDDELLGITSANGGYLVTNDVALKVRARTKHIPTIGYSWQEDYTGIYYLNEGDFDKPIFDSIVMELYDAGKYEVENHTWSENEYLVIRFDNEKDPKDFTTIFKYKNGRFVRLTHKRTIKNEWCGEICPKNPEQECLVDALLDKDIKIIYAGGKYGTGKTFLTNNYAIRELEAGRIKKIVYIPNNSYTQNTMELGALPGDLMDKILPSIGPLVDLVGMFQIQKWLQEDQLEIVPVAYIRGRNFDDSIVLVSEAENLTEEHIKLLLARCGKNTKIFFDGDIHQADSAIFKDRNGLKLLLNLHNSKEFAPVFATAQLNKIERSFVAAAADYLDTI